MIGNVLMVNKDSTFFGPPKTLKQDLSLKRSAWKSYVRLISPVPSPGPNFVLLLANKIKIFLRSSKM